MNEIETKRMITRAMSEGVVFFMDKRLQIRLAEENDIVRVHELIKLTVNVSWPSYYPQGAITYVIQNDFSPDKLRQKIAGSHFYVVIDAGGIIGCGGIKPLDDKPDESVIFTIFVAPNYQGRGIGNTIMKTLENDEYGKRAKRIEISSSLLAVPFYKKHGYEHKNGMLNYELGQFNMEKLLEGK